MGAPGALVVLGDALLDRDLDGRAERLSPDAPVPVLDELSEHSRPGGAGLAAALAARNGRAVTLISALAPDAAAEELRELLARAGVALVDLGLEGQTAEKVRVRTGGRALLRLDRGSEPGTVRAAGPEALGVLAEADAVLVSDYGRGVAAEPALRDALAALPARVPVVWDPHPRGPAPVPGVLVATPNREEARRFAPEADGDSLAALTRGARALAARWRAVNVCITLGERGALLVGGDGAPVAVPVPAAPAGGDPCGAGDAFAASLAGALADGALPSAAVRSAALGAAAFVAAGGASAFSRGAEGPVPPADGDDPIALADRVRASGGTVVATGGCFDILHAGHVRMLAAARALGDCLIVCLNSDASIRRLKGPERPVVEEADRAAVLAALGAVDAVALFDEDTPEKLLDRLRPDLFAKGGDYRIADLPEATLLESWGGQAVVLPYVPGRSTTRLIAEVARRG